MRRKKEEADESIFVLSEACQDEKTKFVETIFTPLAEAIYCPDSSKLTMLRLHNFLKGCNDIMFCRLVNGSYDNLMIFPSLACTIEKGRIKAYDRETRDSDGDDPHQ